MQTAKAGEMRQRLVRQVMALIKYIDAVLRRRQDGAAAEGEIRQGQIVVGNDDIGALQLVAGPEKTALADVGTAPTAALAVVGGDAVPDLLGDRLRPVVPIAIPLAATQGIDHRRVHRQCLGGHRLADLIGIQRQQVAGALALALAEHPVELGQADIAASPLGQHKTEIQPGVTANIRQVLVDELLLQGDGGRGHHQPLVERPGDGNGRHRVGDGFAGAGAGLDHAHCGHFGGRFSRCRNAGESIGDLGNHLALAPAWGELLALDDGAVGLANGALELFAQQGAGVSARSASLLTTALA